MREPIGDDVGVPGCDEDGELVAAKTRDNVGSTCRMGEAIADGVQKRVVSFVSVLVVDWLEAIEVEVEDGDFLTVLSGVLDCAAQSLGELSAVGEPVRSS